MLTIDLIELVSRLFCHCDPVYGHYYVADSDSQNVYLSLGGIAGLLDTVSWHIDQTLEERGVVKEPISLFVHHHASGEGSHIEGLFPLEQVNKILHALKDFPCSFLLAQGFTNSMFPGLSLVKEGGSFALKHTAQ